MNVLIVYAHPEPTSFTAAMKNAALKALSADGHHVEVSDLYAEGFNPVAGRHDFVGEADSERFHYQAEQLHASATGGFSDELKREQARLMRADVLLLAFPLWWGGAPAILKGWFDRVCAYGVAYADGKRFDQGYFVGGRAILGVSTGGTPERFSAGGAYGEIQQVLYPITRCMLEYLGLEIASPFVAYAAPRVDDAARAEYLRQWIAKVRDLCNDADWQARYGALKAASAAHREAVQDQAWAMKR